MHGVCARALQQAFNDSTYQLLRAHNDASFHHSGSNKPKLGRRECVVAPKRGAPAGGCAAPACTAAALSTRWCGSQPILQLHSSSSSSSSVLRRELTGRSKRSHHARHSPAHSRRCNASGGQGADVHQRGGAAARTPTSETSPRLATRVSPARSKQIAERWVLGENGLENCSCSCWLASAVRAAARLLATAHQASLHRRFFPPFLPPFNCLSCRLRRFDFGRPKTAGFNSNPAPTGQAAHGHFSHATHASNFVLGGGH